MKLKDAFITEEIDGSQVMISVDHSLFFGIVRSNETAAEIVDCLKTETTRDQIVSHMTETYDVTEETAAKDVDRILGQLRSISALDE